MIEILIQVGEFLAFWLGEASSAVAGQPGGVAELLGQTIR